MALAVPVETDFREAEHHGRRAAQSCVAHSVQGIVQKISSEVAISAFTGPSASRQ
ncbi:MAG: hypothetical protein IPF83_00970 [Rhodanobacteraceae bacterium]|nr:hypothetical protein [Rhodanobacteraceae bacterium]MBK7042986.1 hypothetical protein [Rhodanobacteraceae bacterium]MBP9155646.1 hypothetical protein [Xanthomonadales bacterium]